MRLPARLPAATFFQAAADRLLDLDLAAGVVGRDRAAEDLAEPGARLEVRQRQRDPGRDLDTDALGGRAALVAVQVALALGEIVML